MVEKVMCLANYCLTHIRGALIMDPVTAIGTGLTVLGSKDLLVKLLGPTADYIGGETRGLVEKCNVNLSHIIQKAIIILGDDINRPGMISPRVLRNLIDVGSFCDNEFTAQYIAGVLSASRTENITDDRGAYLLSLLGRLSNYQIKSHYIFYHSFKDLFSNSIYQWRTTTPVGISIGKESYYESMELDKVNCVESDAILDHCLFGLLHEGLIRGCMPLINRDFNGEPKASFGFHPSIRGIELYAWAHGIQNMAITDLNNTSFKQIISSVRYPSDVIAGSYNLDTWNMS